LGEELAKPFMPILIVWALLHFGRKVAMGRFILTLFPSVYDFKQSVMQDPEDLVVQRRERHHRREVLKMQAAALQANKSGGPTSAISFVNAAGRNNGGNQAASSSAPPASADWAREIFERA